MATTDRPEKQCASCDAHGATKRCSRCKQAYYCNSTCQRNNWGKHKRECKSTNNVNASTKNHNNKDRYTDNDQNECKIDVSHLEHQLNELEKKRATIFGCYEKLQKEFTEFKDEHDTKWELKSIVSCTGNVLKCCHLQRLLLVMNKYHMNDHKILNDTIFSDVLQILNDYLHLMQQHDDDEQFEYTVNQLIECDINNCTSFRRNIRSINDVEDISINRKILDKIHCYFRHSYDIGNRLSFAELCAIDADSDQNISTYENEDNRHQYLVNEKIAKINKKLCTKRKALLSDRLSRRYNQLLSTECKKNVIDSNTHGDKMYRFGYRFNYGCRSDWYGKYEHEDEVINITPRYLSLKEELTSNEICIISMNQFNSENEKAKIHYESDFCKSSFRPFFYDKKLTFYKMQMSQDILLSLMIYSNFTELQYQFSKTYRDNDGKQHDNFYFLGRNLKISTREFGTEVRNGDIKTFYHGVGEQLSFPAYVFGRGSIGFFISCPLSTSSSYEVASSFTNDNKGFVVEFISNGPDALDAKYFSMSWISDYANEKEYLFVQPSCCGGKLQIGNIYDTKLGYEYESILSALRYIDDITVFWRGFQVKEIPTKLQTLALNIIQHQLSKNAMKFVDQFAMTIIQRYCDNKKEIWLEDYQSAKNTPLLALLSHVNFDWLDLDAIHILFPNIRSIIIKAIALSCRIFDDLITIFKQKHADSKIREIKICFDQNVKLSLKDLIDKYTKVFREMELFICGDLHRNTLLVWRLSTVEIVMKLLDGMGELYFLDLNEEIANLITNTVNKQFTGNQNQDEVFSKYCTQKWTLEGVNLKSVFSNPNNCIFKMFYYTDIEWIDLEVVEELFPNILTVSFLNVNLNAAVLDSIWKHLSSIINRSQIEDIDLWPHSISEFSVFTAASMYKQQFQKINYNIDGKENHLHIEVQQDKEYYDDADLFM